MKPASRRMRRACVWSASATITRIGMMARQSDPAAVSKVSNVYARAAQQARRRP